MNFLRSLVQKITGKPVDWDELEESFIRADLGVPMTMRILASLQERAATTTITSKDVVEVAREEIGRVLPRSEFPIVEEKNIVFSLKSRGLRPSSRATCARCSA